MPIGTLIRNTNRQPVPHRLASTSAPASTGAASIGSPIAGPNSPIALPSSSAGKTSLIIPKPCGIISAPKAPCSASGRRSARSIEGAVGAGCRHQREAGLSRSGSRRRRPNMSPSRAPRDQEDGEGRACSRRLSHCRVAKRCRRGRRWIEGPATLTIVASIRSIMFAAEDDGEDEPAQAGWRGTNGLGARPPR